MKNTYFISCAFVEILIKSRFPIEGALAVISTWMYLKSIDHCICNSLQVACLKTALAKPFYFHRSSVAKLDSRLRDDLSQSAIRCILMNISLYFQNKMKCSLHFMNIMTSFFSQTAQIMVCRCSTCLFVDWWFMHLRTTKAGSWNRKQ